MSGVFQNIAPPPPHRPAIVYPSAFGAGGGHTRWVERGWGVNILKDARHSPVLYIRKYFCSTTGKPTRSFATERVSLDSV